MTQLVNDSGTGTDASPIAAPWLIPSASGLGAIRRISNKFATVSPDTDSQAYRTDVASANQWCSVVYDTLGTTNSDGGGALRMNGVTGDCYFWTFFGGQVHLFRLVAGGFNEVAQTTATVAQFDVVYGQAVGTGVSTVVTIIQNVTTRIVFADNGGAAINTGNVGMQMFDGGLRFTNFLAGDFATAGAVMFRARDFSIYFN